MSIVRPFKGVKYNFEKVLLKQVLTPPYDVITPEMREKFVMRSDYNVVKIDLPIGGDNRYSEAGNLYKAWQESKVLVKSISPAFYLYEQVYDYEGKSYVRTGFIGLLKLSEFGKGVVFPHEKTHAGPKVDRYELMKESNANFSQIFGLYKDSYNTLSSLFNDIKKNMPTASAVDDDCVRHTVWEVSETEQIQKIQSFMQDKSIYIADGHHRYETAVKFRDDMRIKNRDSADEAKPYDFVMMMFVNFHDDGLKVFPTHRVVDVDENFSDEEFLKSVEKKFDIVKLEDKLAVNNFMKETSKSSGSFAFLGRKGYYGLKINNEAVEDMHTIYRKVNTYLLESLILKPQFKFTDELLSSKKGIHFIQTYDDIRKYMDKTPAVAFMLHSEELDIIREVSEAGLVMPQKSTYFYPKLATGLVFNDL